MFQRFQIASQILYRSIADGVNYSRITWINPREIHYCTVYNENINISRNNGKVSAHFSDQNRGYFLISDIGKKVDGDWDLNRVTVTSMKEYVALLDVIKQNKMWIETNFSKHVQELIQLGFPHYGYSDVDCYLRNRGLDVSNLILSVKKHGVKPTGNCIFFSGYYDNVQVNISRDNRYFFNGGFHRFCIAHILGLPLIPVIVVARHVDSI